MNNTDGLQLVSCLPPVYSELPPLPESQLHASVKEEDEEKLADCQAKKKDAALANESWADHKMRRTTNTIGFGGLKEDVDFVLLFCHQEVRSSVNKKKLVVVFVNHAPTWF